MKSTKKAETDGLVFAEGATGSFGDVEVSDDDMKPESTRVRISMMVPGDVLALLRVQAKKKGKPYQTLANDILRAAVMGGDDPALESLANRLSKIEKMIATITPQQKKARAK